MMDNKKINKEEFFKEDDSEFTKEKNKTIAVLVIALILIGIGIFLISNSLTVSNSPKVVFDIPMQSGVRVPK